MAELVFHQNNPIRALINEEIERRNLAGIEPTEWCVPPHRPGSNKRRRYLGGSVVGLKCTRAGWYGYHWVADIRFSGRMLRLFDRGHLEEPRFITWLTMIGAEVQAVDPDTVPILWYHPESDCYFTTLPTDPNPQEGEPLCENVTGTFHEWIARANGVEIPEPKQFSWVALDGHHKGNSDGRARFLPEQERWLGSRDEWVLTEYKTHGESSFLQLIAKGVKGAKPEHWAQMQRYMEKLRLRLALYCAVNKNTDDLYFEYVPFDPTAGAKFDVTAKESIYSLKPPPRISNSPSWYDCKFCDWRPQCHFGAPFEKNCRTCMMSRPVENGRWLCTQWGKLIPETAEADGCGAWKQITD